MEKYQDAKSYQITLLMSSEDKLVNIITISKFLKKFITEVVDKFDKNSWFYLCQKQTLSENL